MKPLLLSAFSDLVHFARWRDAEAERYVGFAAQAERDGHGVDAEVWRVRVEHEKAEAERLRSTAVELYEKAKGIKS